MDFTMMLGGLYISLLQGLGPEGAERALDTLHRIANRKNLTPGERDIFQKIADSVCCEPTVRPPLRVIEGGAA